MAPIWKEKYQNKTELVKDLEAKISGTQRELHQLAADRNNERTRLEAKIDKLGKVRNQLQGELNQEIQAHQKTKQVHHGYLQELFAILRPTTGFLNLDNLNGDNITYDLVKEQAQACQEQKANL